MRANRLRRGAVLLAAVSLAVAACEGPRSRENARLRVNASQNGSNGNNGTGSGGHGGGGNSNFASVDTSQCTGNPTEGINGNTITLGTSLPESGLYSAFTQILQGEKAYFAMRNAQGGISIAGKQYQIKIVDKDDAYEANRTSTNVQELVNSTKVFALFNVVGTTNNFAIRDFISQQCVPDLFAATGSPAWGDPHFPFVLGTDLVPYPLEVKAFVDYLKQHKPNATIAALYASDDFGGAYKATLHSLVGGSGLKIVKEAEYNPDNPDTKSQVTSLASSNADAFLLGATLLGCPNTLSNIRATTWRPLTYMSGTCAATTLMQLAGQAADGVLTSAPLLDPAAPTTETTPAYATYAQAVKQYGGGADPKSSIVEYGYTTAAILEVVLTKATKADRYAVMQSARNLTVSGAGLMLPGATFTTDANDWFLGETYQLAQFSFAKQYFVPVTPVIDDNGKTVSITPKSLIQVSG